MPWRQGTACGRYDHDRKCCLLFAQEGYVFAVVTTTLQLSIATCICWHDSRRCAFVAVNSEELSSESSRKYPSDWICYARGTSLAVRNAWLLEAWSSFKLYLQIQFVPHRKHYVTAAKPNRLMLFREIIAVYCENHTEHIHTLCGQKIFYQCIYVPLWINCD
jgi:hypothetical protein